MTRVLLAVAAGVFAAIGVLAIVLSFREPAPAQPKPQICTREDEAAGRCSRGTAPPTAQRLPQALPTPPPVMVSCDGVERTYSGTDALAGFERCQLILRVTQGCIRVEHAQGGYVDICKDSPESRLPQQPRRIIAANGQPYSLRLVACSPTTKPVPGKWQCA